MAKNWMDDFEEIPEVNNDHWSDHFEEIPVQAQAKDGVLDTIKEGLKNHPLGAAYNLLSNITNNVTPNSDEMASRVNSMARGAVQGVSMGFADELTGVFQASLDKLAQNHPEKFMDLYKKHRDESRVNNKAAQEENPWTYGTGELTGAAATMLIPGVAPVKGASMTTNIGKMAVQGAIAGIGTGSSEPNTTESVADIAKDAALGGVIGGVAGTAGELVSKGINKIAPKAASLLSGVDEDAARRQLERPLETKLAEADDAAYKIGKQAMGEISSLGDDLGMASGEARNAAVSGSKPYPVKPKVVKNLEKEIIPSDNSLDFDSVTPEYTPANEFINEIPFEELPPIAQRTKSIVADTDKFLNNNTVSGGGMSGIVEKERTMLEAFKNALDNPNINIEDLVKFREQVDRNLSHLYGKEGAANLYERQLMRMRGQVDTVLDSLDQNIGIANQNYSKYIENKNILGIKDNEARAESIVNNLYSGVNKEAKKKAANELLNPDTLEKIQDLAANKAFENAKGPMGSEFGVRRILGAVGALPTAGVSLIATSPRSWQHILRSMGKYAAPLQNALERGPQAFAVTHFILSQSDPEYRNIINNLSSEDENE